MGRIGILFFALVIASSGQSLAAPQKAADAVLDLRFHSFSKDGPVRLEGEWRMYWNQLHQTPPDDGDHQLINLPALWNGYAWQGEELGSDGYATFHLKMLLQPEEQLLSVKMPYMYTAFRMYIDSILVAENGDVGPLPSGHTPQFLPKIASFRTSRSGEIDVIIQVSNFSDRKGGIWEVPLIGTTDEIVSGHSLALALEFFVMGALALFGFYQIGIYFMHKEDRSSLYFGIFCLVRSVDSLFIGSVFIQTILPTLSWEWIVKLEYMVMISMPVFFFLFLQALFPGYIKKWVTKAFVGFTVLAFLFILLTTKKTFGFLLYGILVQITAMAYYAMKILVLAMKDRKRGSFNAFYGVLILMLFIVNDVLFGLEIINTGNYLSFGLLIFVGIQSLNIAYIFSKAFKDVKNLTNYLSLTNKSYSRFVPSAFLDFLGKTDINKVALGDQKRAEMSILFVDIRSFTTLSETMSPQENFSFINEYLSEVSPVIRKHGGFVDKYIGDAIMALFPGKPLDAVNASVDILRSLESFNAKRAISHRQPIRVGMGLNTGTVMLGTVGEAERMDTTVISDAVNLASRLEMVAKLNNIQIVTTQNTMDQIKRDLQVDHRIIFKGKVKGKTELLTLYEIFSETIDSDYKAKMEIKETYARAIDAYHLGNIAAAKQLFSEVSAILPSDQPAKKYFQRCERYLSNGLPEGWDGFERLDDWMS